MRWQEFKLAENKQSEQVQVKKAENHLNALVSSAVELPDDDPVKKKVAKTLGQLNTALTNFVNKIESKFTNKQPQQAQPEVKEALEDLSQEIQNKANECYETMERLDGMYQYVEGNPAGQKELDDIIAQVDVKLYDLFLVVSKEHKALKDALSVAEGKAKEVEDFFRGLLPLLRSLGNKVNDYTELTQDELQAMSGTERAQAKKKAVNAGKFAQTLAEAMSGKVLKLLSEGQTDTKRIKEFLEACLAGNVINLDNMVQDNQGLIDNFVNEKYKQDYQNFVVENIFSYNPGATSGAIGPGELALAMLGDPASKATEGGDLYIGKGKNKKLYEIKAGKGTSGGRMNSKKIVSATAAYPMWEKGINKILRDAKATGTFKIIDQKGKPKNIEMKFYDGSTHNKTGKGFKKGSNYNFNPSGIEGLNNDILKPYAEAAATNIGPGTSAKDVTYELFHESFKVLIGNNDEIKNFGNVIYNAINDDGTVDYMTMAKAYTSLAYKSYQLADKVKDILFIRTDTRHFAIINDHDDFMDSIAISKDESGKDKQTGRVVIGSGFTWNDDQQTPTPTYLSNKHD